MSRENSHGQSFLGVASKVLTRLEHGGTKVTRSEAACG